MRAKQSIGRFPIRLGLFGQAKRQPTPGIALMRLPANDWCTLFFEPNVTECASRAFASMEIFTHDELTIQIYAPLAKEQSRPKGNK